MSEALLHPVLIVVHLWCKLLKGQYPCASLSARQRIAEDASAFHNNLDPNFNTFTLLS